MLIKRLSDFPNFCSSISAEICLEAASRLRVGLCQKSLVRFLVIQTLRDCNEAAISTSFVVNSREEFVEGRLVDTSLLCLRFDWPVLTHGG